ncbi:urease subunit beta, partial [Streptomyces zhihengii]
QHLLGGFEDALGGEGFGRHGVCAAFRWSRLTRVRNTASVPVSVTSHFHFFEANPRLSFDRSAAYGMRLAVPAGSSVRFDAGATEEVGLLPIGGDRVSIGFAGLVDGPLDAPGAKEEALRRAAACGYLGTDDADDYDGDADAHGTEGTEGTAP